MDKLVILILVFIVLLVVEILIYRSLYPDQTDFNDNQWKLWLAVGVTLVVLIVIFVFNNGPEMEYGFFKKKDENVPKVAPAPGLDRNPGGNPMKKQQYNPKIRDDEPVDADKIYGGAAAAADPNRKPLYSNSKSKRK